MTNETKKPSEQLAEIIASLPKPPPMTITFPVLDALPIYLDAEAERRAAWEKGVANKLVAQDQLLAKLLALNPEALDVIGTTTSGGVVHGLVHIASRDSLSRYGTGHPSEEPCIICKRPTYDIIYRYQTANGGPLCSKACFDRVQAAPVGVYEGDGHPRARGYEPTEETAET